MNISINSKFVVVTFSLFAILASGSLHAAEDPATSGLDQMEASVLDRARTNHVAEMDMAPVLEALRHAEQHKCPIEPLVQKIDEGLAKNIPPQRIAAVLQTLISRFERFGLILDRAQAMGGRQRFGLMERMNSLVGMGVDIEELAARSEKKDAPDWDQLLNAYETRAALENSGVSADNATRLMETGLKNGFFAAPGMGLARLVRMAGCQGVAQESSLKIAEQVVLRQKTLGVAAQDLGLEWGGYGRGRGGAGGQGYPGGCANGVNASRWPDCPRDGVGGGNGSRWQRGPNGCVNGGNGPRWQ